jgi:uncharacterized protein YndB with AHSA1/START domain
MARDIVLGIEIEAEPKVVFDRVATASGIASFWTPDVEGEGDELSLGFGSAPSRLPLHVTRSDSPRAIEWSFGGDWPFWGGSTGSWSFAQSELGTKVLFRHLDYGEGMPDLEFGSVAMTWATVVGALKRVAETGNADPALR